MARKAKGEAKVSKKNKKAKKRVASNATQQKSSKKTSTIKIQVQKMPTEVELQKEMRKIKPKKKSKANKNKTLKPKANKRLNVFKRKKSLKKLLKLIGIICLVIAAGAFLCTTPLFNVTEIIVDGNEAVSSEEIISLSQIKLNDNMFKNVKSKISNNIKGNAYIEDVDIKRILPNKIQLTVQERQVKFMAKLLNNYAYINSQGYILEITDQTKEVPVIEGVSTPEEDIIVGKRLDTDDLKGIEVALKIVSACEENEISRYITSINISNPTDYIMGMTEKGKVVHLGNSSNLSTKILYVKAILQAEEGVQGDIFVNGDLNDGFQPFFREKV